MKPARRGGPQFRSTAENVLTEFHEVIDKEVFRVEKALVGDLPPPPISTGIAKLDRMAMIEPGMLLIIGGVTGSGKSSLCGNIAVNVARGGDPVVFVTSEMTHREMLYRVASNISGQPVCKLRDLNEAIERGALDTYTAIRGLPLLFQRSFPPRMEDAKAAIRVGVVRYGAKLAVVDYVQRLAEADDIRHEQAIASIARECKNLALELGIPVIAAAQVNRQPGARNDPRPYLSDLRGSGEIEQNADMVWFVHRPEQYGKQGSPQILIAKQRNGPVGELDVYFNAALCTFGSIG